MTDWEYNSHREWLRRRTLEAADALGIDPERFRGNVPGTTIDALEHEVHRVARLLAPCRACGSTGPRVQDSAEWCDMLLCDGCRSLDRKQAAAEQEEFLRMSGFGRRRQMVGAYQPDGLGCVEKVGSVERVWLNGGESPYG